MNFNPTIEQLIAGCDQIACELYNQGRYEESIDQNLITLKLLGHRNPSVLRNIASAYYQIPDVEKSLEYFREYMDITKSEENGDIRQFAQYLTRTNRFDEAREIIFNQKECTDKHLDMGFFLHREGKFKEAFIETEKIGRAHV